MPSSAIVSTGARLRLGLLIPSCMPPSPPHPPLPHIFGMYILLIPSCLRTTKKTKKIGCLWGWGRLAGLEAGQSNPSKSVWSRLEAEWGRRQPFLGQGHSLPPPDLICFSAFDAPYSHLTSFCNLDHTVRSCGVCGTTLRIIWQKRNLTTWKKCVQPKKVCGKIAWIGHLVVFLLAHFSSDVYIIPTRWNILLPIWEVVLLRKISSSNILVLWRFENIELGSIFLCFDLCLSL